MEDRNDQVQSLLETMKGKDMRLLADAGLRAFSASMAGGSFLPGRAKDLKDDFVGRAAAYRLAQTLVKQGDRFFFHILLI